MLKKELLDILVANAKEYRKQDVPASLTRNRHMNQYEGERISGQTIDAILADYINFVAYKQGVDLGLYTKDFEE